MSFFDSIYAADLSHRAKAVYMYLKDRADKDGQCWPGINTIAAELRLSRSTVKRALDDLVKAGLVEKTPRWRENGSYTSNLYRVNGDSGCVSRSQTPLDVTGKPPPH